VSKKANPYGFYGSGYGHNLTNPAIALIFQKRPLAIQQKNIGARGKSREMFTAFSDD
jgi:hypothetical protein